MSNLIGLVILITGSLALNQYAAELVKARIDNMQSQAGLITSVMGDTATGYGVTARLDEEQATTIINRLNLPPEWRVRLHDKNGQLIADRDSFKDSISVGALAPIGAQSGALGGIKSWPGKANIVIGQFMHELPWRSLRRKNLRRNLQEDIKAALSGEYAGGERYDADDNLIVTVSLPVKRVQQVLGVITLESADVDDIIAGERRALVPFIGLAFVAALLSSTALTLFIVQPLRHLSSAAEYVSKSSTNRGVIPNFSDRHDEIGDLSVVLREMTSGLYSRIDDIANFAADVAHEIKNPLTSLRSASDTLRYAKDDSQREKLIDIIQKDVIRMDRLISDISSASKVDAGLARETAQVIDVDDILANITEFYLQTQKKGSPAVVHEKRELPVDTPNEAPPPLFIKAYETPFAQVLRNLIDNAITFSPKGGDIRIKARSEKTGKTKQVVITVDDDGPGIPPDNLETVFDRFYTERPKGAKFGSHSGLGLAICRQIITAHKGEIHAENRAHEGEITGARFVIKFPGQNPPA